MRGQRDNLDLYIGAQIRLARKARGWSQPRLSQLFGISYQQIQKYERGTDRIRAAALFRLAGLLGIDLPGLFDGLAAVDRGACDGARPAADDDGAGQLVELVAAYADLPSADDRAAVLAFCAFLGGKAAG